MPKRADIGKDVQKKDAPATEATGAEPYAFRLS